MTVRKYTPGPWTIAETVKTARIDGARLIRPVDHKNYEYGATAIIGTSEADARLIAAAPELLEALQALLDDQRDARLPVLEKARAAITKATKATKATNATTEP